MSEEIKENQNPESCTHDCSSCGSNCPSRNGGEAPDFRAPMNKKSSIRKVIGVVSGKGGVGKSFVTSMLAVMLRKQGKNVGILDADITGPSIPKAFGVTAPCGVNDEDMILPKESTTGIKIMSLNLLTEAEDMPVIWRGPVIAGTVKQFWTDCMWGDVDYLLVDMPPGTGDVPLTVFQSLPVDGIVLVTSPQDLVSMIVGKAVNMARMMSIPILGIVENYSYMTCPHCGEKLSVFGESSVEETAAKYGTRVLARLPIMPQSAADIDAGLAETVKVPELESAVTALLSL